jgi:tetratricopeptide (TPR) repeat protein
MKMLRLFCFAAVCAAFLLSACGPGQTADERMQKSMTAAKAGNWELALDEARKAVKKDSGNTLANVLLAIALENNSHPEEALKAAKKAAESDKACFIAQYTLGRLCCRQQKYADCIEPLTRAMEIRPDDTNTIILLARAKTRMNNFEEAINLYRRLLEFPEFSDSAMLYNEIGVLHVRKNEPDMAPADFQRAFLKDSENPIPHLNYAILYDYYLRNRRDSADRVAREHYQKFLNKTANRPELGDERRDVEKRLKEIR